MARYARRSLRDLLRLRAVAAVLLVGFASVTWWWTIDDLHAWRQHRALDMRGVTTTATVLSYSYDAEGGDPGGWTTDHVRFATAGRGTVVATVGHHDPGPERFNRVIDVTYDPQHLNVVRAAHFPDDADDPSNIVAGAMVAALVTTAAAFTIRFATRQSGDSLIAELGS
jgi:hypothetical protein